jgi:hypothetical protein
MIPQEKWVIIQPTHHHGQICPSHKPWNNDSFSNLSRLFKAPMYHILDEFVDETADVYFIENFDIGLVRVEIEFAEAMKERGAKIVIGFSQDMRFFHGAGMMNNDGYSWIDLCAISDCIASGGSYDLRIYGRYQDKVIPWGEVLEDLDFSIPYEERTIDFLTSGATGEETISFEVEMLLMLKEKYPDKRFVCLIRNGAKDIGLKLQERFPQIEFPFEGQSLMYYMQQTKTYCNIELRPRPARALMEAYYCRVPLIGSAQTYHSNLCPEFTFTKTDFYDIADKYELLLSKDPKTIIKDMEERAKFDLFDSVYKRIKDKIKI